jgi:hypothetical protein
MPTIKGDGFLLRHGRGGERREHGCKDADANQ